MGFAKHFTWGVASAAYQIEGAAFEDGKGPSIWDMFCRKPGAIWRGQNGDIACDHYHRFRDDVALMKELGIPAYRFSISWPRVLPEGTGTINEKGIGFYDALVDELLAAGITPWATLFHWDFPLALYHRGGWLNRDSARWFADYTACIVDRLSDRVTHWMPQNEPQVYIGLLLNGYHAPGDRLRMDEVLLAAHHSLLAHGCAVQTIRARARSKPTIGTALVGLARMPHTNSPQDIEAARRATFAVPEPSMFTNTWWMDPLIVGKYPADGLKIIGSAAPRDWERDMPTIQQPLDFLGVNIYHGMYVRANAQGDAEAVPLPPGYPKTTQDFWPITPDCLYWAPKFLYEHYRLPIVITENGHQNADVIHLDGKVHDPQRIDYLHRYLRELKRAASEGADIRGYFQWCFADNFEWAMGDAIRVGIVYTDYPTQQRIPKDSAFWYREVVRSNGSEL